MQDVFVDERFAREAPALAVHATTRPRAGCPRVGRQPGRDVTDLVATQDGRYLATFARGPYQGVARDHFVEFEIDEIAAATGPHVARRERLDLSDRQQHQRRDRPGRHRSRTGSRSRRRTRRAAGSWSAPDLGFPAGKNKTILIDLSRVARAGVARPQRLRLRTNLEIYWDSLAVAESAGGPAPNMNRLQPARAELRYRGFSKTDYAKHDVPETPHYDQLANVGQRWRDLAGYYTRFGDVRRAAGVGRRSVRDHERRRRTAAGVSARPRGRRPRRVDARDFVLIGDGWVKDGDYNTSYSKTVLPLPRHQHPDYKACSADARTGRRSRLPAARTDWQTYHTRFVTPRAFLGGLR